MKSWIAAANKLRRDCVMRCFSDRASGHHDSGHKPSTTEKHPPMWRPPAPPWTMGVQLGLRQVDAVVARDEDHTICGQFVHEVHRDT
jgi:hypothetical protein